jgi:hypothetical protein
LVTDKTLKQIVEDYKENWEPGESIFNYSLEDEEV